MDLKDKYLAIEKGIINIGFVLMCKNSPDNSWSSKTYCFLSGYNLFDYVKTNTK